MKTAISIPDPLFKQAEKFARRQRRSRSDLYSTALAEYLARQSDEDITRRLNQVYSAVDSRLDPALARLPGLLLEREDW